MAIAAALLAPAASAATLIGDYQLQGTRASSGPGPTLTDIGAGPGAFTSESVMGTTRRVLVFPLHGGVQMSPTGLPTSTAPYSVVTTFRLADVSGYRRILDVTNGTLDNGVYDHNGLADYFRTASLDHEGPSVVFADDAYTTVAIIGTDPGFARTRVYVNGTPQVDYGEREAIVSDALRFFKDNDTEDSAGAVSCIRVYSGALTAAEVSAIGPSPTCGAPAPPGTSAHKKCKKKHKKRSAGVAKKKCKKMKRR